MYRRTANFDSDDWVQSTNSFFKGLQLRVVVGEHTKLTVLHP